MKNVGIDRTHVRTYVSTPGSLWYGKSPHKCFLDFFLVLTAYNQNMSVVLCIRWHGVDLKAT